jgi:nucleotide-binding universal stress UspA family protein
MSHRNIFRRILFCTDFSPNSDLAFKHALNIAEGNAECELVLLHIVPEADAQFWKSYIYEIDKVDDKAKRDIDLKVESAYLSKIPPTVVRSVRFAVGSVEQKILETAEETGADLIVIGRHGRCRLGTLFFGKVTERIARRAPCPVLIVPGK